MGDERTYDQEWRFGNRASFPECPHCGRKVGEPWELELEDGDITEVECAGCAKPFGVKLSVVWEYETAPPDEPEESAAAAPEPS